MDNIFEHFAKRTKAADIKSKSPERRQMVIENGEAAKRLFSNQDFGLMVNLYRFSILSAIEDTKTDEERITLSYALASLRDFATFLEQQEANGKRAQHFES